MKKIILTMIMALTMMFTANAQVATENAKFFDNVGIGVTAGVSTPLDFNSMFPLNTNVGLKLTKDITPVLGFQVEGLAIFNDNHFGNIKNGLKATNVGVNGVINLSNTFGGYKGTPRTFEISAVGGLGWIHYFNQEPKDPSISDYIPNLTNNGLTAKTGVDLAFNLGKKKAHSLVITPAVYWSLYRGGEVSFSKGRAQLALNLSYVYHFKTSNGTHSFKTYDIGAMTNEINRLNDELNKKPKEVEVIKYVDRVVNNYNAPVITKETVFFAFDSAELDANAKETLDKLGQNGVYVVRGYASNEGSTEYNKALSLKRAEAVANYLRNRGTRVDTVEGLGVVFGPTTGRVAVITTK